MPRFSRAFRIGKTQAELDFVDVQLETDNPLFLDPFALSQRSDRWSLGCHLTLVTFFQRVVDEIRGGHEGRAMQLLRHLREPNETRLGFSVRRPDGAGIGDFQSRQLYEALRDSSAVRTGFLSSLEECELMIEGIGPDKISDLTTNIIRAHLVKYSLDQCELHGIAVEQVALPPSFDQSRSIWTSNYVDLPVWQGRPVVLVPKAIVRYDPAYEHRRYYRNFVLPYLQAEELRAGSSLVHTLQSGRRVVYKKDVAAQFPCTKDFLYRFSREHPEVLREYRDTLARMERSDRASEVDDADEREIARALQASLQAISAGSDSASEYHRFMVGAVEFVFFPKLLYPRKEQEIHQGRKRIDILMENGAQSGVFQTIPSLRRLPCAYVPFECKNYVTEVGNPELDQLAGRFSTNRGMLGFLCCRHFEDRGHFVERCRDTFRDGRGLILPLDDQHVLRLLGLIEQGHRGHLEREISDLVAEVWIA
jgi:hypothetical protein